MSLRAVPVMLLLLGLWLAPMSAMALDPDKAFHHYVRNSWSVQEGMPQISAVSIAQTPDGYIWVATQAGVSRFDGVAFTTHSPATDPGLPHPVITALLVDADGAMWIGTRGGMAVLRDGAFHAVPWTGEGDSPRVNDLHIAADGVLWVATNAGVARVDGGMLNPLPDGIATYAVLEKDGELWAGALEEMRRWDGHGWTPSAWPGAAAPLVYDMLEVDGEIWAATGRGLWIRDRSGWKPFPGAAGEGALPLVFLYRDGDGNVWGGGDLGLVRVRPDRSVETVHASRGNGLFNLFGAFEDREGNLWLGSLSNGLTRIWNGWTRRYSTGDGLPDATVWALVPDPDGNGIWVGTNNGLARLRDDGAFELPRTGRLATSNSIRALHAEPGQLWIGLRDGLVLYEPGRGATAHTPGWARSIRNPVTGFARDPDGSLWVNTHHGLMRWDGSQLEHFGAGQGLDGLLAEFRITSDGRRLGVSSTTLLEFDGEGFVPAPEARHLPPDVRLYAVTELADGRLLMSAEGTLLLLWDRGRWHKLDGEAGLPTGTAFQVLELGGFLWVSSMHGVYRLPMADLDGFIQGRLPRVGAEVLVNERGAPNGGQQGVCCNGSGPSDGFAAGDSLWLPTRDGVLALDSLAIIRNPVAPAVHVRPPQAGAQPRLPDARGDTILEADERDLTLAFDVLSFQDPRSNGARYRLAGYDQDWHVAESMARQVRYTNLPPGRYTFEVMGGNNADAWSATPARLEFAIQPYFHETVAFRMLLAALAALLVFAGYRYQRHRFRIRQAQLETLVGERTAALAASNLQLEQASLTDPLTGLRNRRYLARQVPADLDYYDRQLAGSATDHVVVFAMLDLDFFKQVNDRHGHAAGDRVLVDTANRLQALVRRGDYVVRWGGEEFLLVFRPMAASQVAKLGERLCRAVSDTSFDVGGERAVELTASVGLSAYPLFRTPDGQPLGWEAMVELADQALYHVKRNGRNGWAMFHPTLSTRVETLIQDLQRGADALVRKGELVVTPRDAADPGAGLPTR